MANDKKNASLPYDRANKPIQVAGSMQEHDDAETAVVSPKVLASGQATLTVPENAVALVVRCTKAFRYANNPTMDGSAEDKGYMVGTADLDTRVPCAKSSAIYVKPDSYSAIVYFFFEML